MNLPEMAKHEEICTLNWNIEKCQIWKPPWINKIAKTIKYRIILDQLCQNG